MNKPNIIFIVLDTLRADKVLQIYKKKRLTPTIESLLSNSIYFDNCIANSPWTLPSHTSMFTGLYYSEVKNISSDYNYVSHKIPLITEILKNIGYSTVCFTENPFINKVFGLGRGFDKIFDYWKTTREVFSKNKIFNLVTRMLKKIDFFLNKKVKSLKILSLWKLNRRRIMDLLYSFIRKLFWKNLIFNFKTTLTQLRDFSSWLKINKSKTPFYLFFNIMATHDPYFSIPEVRKYFNLSKMDFRVVKNIVFNSRKKLDSINLNSKHLSEKEIKTIEKVYNSSVFYSDLILKRILSILRTFGIEKNSYLIITSDHGEHLCNHLDHYLWGHFTNISVYRSLLKVPLLIYNRNFKQRKVEKQVELKDIFHTILHITGVSEREVNCFKLNKSILNQINTDSEPEFIFGEYIKDERILINKANFLNRFRNKIKRNLILKVLNNIYFLRNNNYKYIKYNHAIEELYDIISDPHEQINLVHKNLEILEIFRNKVAEFIANINNPNILKKIMTEIEMNFIDKWSRNLTLE